MIFMWNYSKKTFSRSFYSQPQIEQGRQFERYTFNRRRQRNHINCLIGREASMLLVEMYVQCLTSSQPILLKRNLFSKGFTWPELFQSPWYLTEDLAENQRTQERW